MSALELEMERQAQRERWRRREIEGCSRADEVIDISVDNLRETELTDKRRELRSRTWWIHRNAVRQEKVGGLPYQKRFRLGSWTSDEPNEHGWHVVWRVGRVVTIYNSQHVMVLETGMTVVYDPSSRQWIEATEAEEVEPMVGLEFGSSEHERIRLRMWEEALAEERRLSRVIVVPVSMIGSS